VLLEGPSLMSFRKQNLKRHGILPAFFANKADYDLIDEYQTVCQVLVDSRR
jgi:hypothetical protein